MPAPAHCPRCTGPLVAIALPLHGRRLHMRSCSTCDRRWWHDGATEVDLVEVLGRQPARQPALR